MTATAIDIGTAGAAEVPREHLPQVLVAFRVGSIRLGIDIRQVREVVRAVPLCDPPPNKKGVAGMIVLRGESTAVVDLNRAFDLPVGQRDRQARMIAVRHGDSSVCLLVDRVDGLHELAEADLETPPELVAGAFTGWLDFVAPTATGDLVGVINVPRVLSHILV